jgi:DNA primase
LEPILQEDIYPRIVSVEGEKDPDEIIAEQGKAHFDQIIKNAPDFVDSILKQAFADGDMSLQKKAEVGKQLMALIGQSPNDILKSEWTRRVAEKLGLGRDSLIKELKKQPVAQEQAPRFLVAKRGMPTAEEEFLELLLVTPQLFSTLDFSSDDFLEAKHRKLFGLMAEQMKATGRLTVPGLLEDMPAEYRDWLIQLTLEEKVFSDPVDRCQQLVRDIRTKRTREQLARLKDRVISGQANGEEQMEYKNLLKQIKGSSSLSS